MAEAAAQVVDVAPANEKEFWEAVVEVYDNTTNRNFLRMVVAQGREIDYLVEERCGFRVP